MKTVLVLDGDSIAYRCASAAERRFITVTHEPTGKTKEFKHRTEFKKSMLEKGKEITDDYSVTDGQEPEPIEYVLSTVKNHVNRIAEYCQADEIIVFAGEQFNFRAELPLPKKYKGPRVGNIRPVHLAKAKEYLRYKYNGQEAVGWEVDDAASIAAYDALKAGHKSVMYRYEKDQDSFDGITLLIEDDSGIQEKVVPQLGSLTYEKSKVKGDGLKWLAHQWTAGDSSDFYCAYDLSSVKYGEKKSYDLLNPCATEQEVLQSVIKQFQIFYPEPFEYTDWTGKTQQSDWKGMMEMYYKCCRMKRSEDDKLDCYELFDKYNVKI